MIYLNTGTWSPSWTVIHCHFWPWWWWCPWARSLGLCPFQPRLQVCYLTLFTSSILTVYSCILHVLCCRWTSSVCCCLSTVVPEAVLEGHWMTAIYSVFTFLFFAVLKKVVWWKPTTLFLQCRVLSSLYETVRTKTKANPAFNINQALTKWNELRSNHFHRISIHWQSISSRTLIFCHKS